MVEREFHSFLVYEEENHLLKWGKHLGNGIKYCISNNQCTDQVADHAPITRLIIHCSLDTACTDHMEDHALTT